MERYVELFGPLTFMIIYSSLYVIGMMSVSYMVYKLIMHNHFSTKLGCILSLIYFIIGLWISRKHVLLTEE